MAVIIRLPRCPERISDDGRTYRRCARPVHGGYCWAAGIAWRVAGETQDRHSAPPPADVMVPVDRRAQRPAQHHQQPPSTKPRFRGKRR